MKDYSDYSINKDIFFSGAERKYEILVHFNDVGESTLEQDKELYQYSYQDIQQILMDNTKLTNVSETISRFWDMFIVDALNGNFDRHGGNWGFIKKNNQYVISPYWGMIEQLPEGIFSGIPGIDLEHRKEQYYRVNLTPSFIEMRTPSPSREDLWELLEEVGLDYYDRFEWMLRAGKRCGDDNLIVVRKREQKRDYFSLSVDDLNDLQPQDVVFLEEMYAFGRAVLR